MPMFTIALMGLPVKPFHSPERTRSAKPLILSSTACTSGTTFTPSVTIDSSFGARRATCSTARFSVMLILLPENMSSIFDRRPDCSTSVSSRRRVSSEMRFFEKSTKRPAASREYRVARSGSSANICFNVRASIPLKWSASAAHAAVVVAVVTWLITAGSVYSVG